MRKDEVGKRCDIYARADVMGLEQANTAERCI